jgi:hypothetical protein
MSSTPIDDMTARGYEAPQVTQFSVFLDNRVGKLRELVEVFDGHALDLVSLSVVDSTDHAVVRVITSRAALARRLLRRHHMAFSEIDVLVVELGPGQRLVHLCQSLLSAEVNILYAYPLMVRCHGNPTIALHTDDEVMAAQVLRRKMFTLLGENDLGDNATPSDPDEPWRT